MGIQSSINSLLSQAQSLAAFYKGFEKAGDIIKGQEATKNEAKIQTDIAAGNAPMKDGKVDPEWLKKRREQYNSDSMFGGITLGDAIKAVDVSDKIKKGVKLTDDEKMFADGKKVESINNKNANIMSELFKMESYVKSNSELKNKVASDLARGSVEARTASINQTKSNFDEHTASLIRYYGKGSGNP